MKFSKQIAFTVFSLLLSVGILAYIFTSVSLGEAIQRIKDSDPRGVALFFLFSFAMSLFRTWRYLLILRVSGYRPQRVAMFLVTLVRNFCSDLLPARIGTLAYVFVVTTRIGIPLEAALSSFTLSFTFDLLAIVPLILIATVLVGNVGLGSPVGIVIGSIILAVAFGGVIGSLPRLFRALAALAKKFGREGIGEKLLSTEREIHKARTEGIYTQLLVLSMLVRFAKYGGLYMFLYALMKPMGFGFAELHPAKVFFGVCAAEFAASLPISGIAGFGLYQGTWLVVFQLLGFEKDIAAVTSLSHHLFTQLYGYSIGLAALVLLSIPWMRVKEALTPRVFVIPSNFRFATQLILALLVLGGTGAGIAAAPESEDAPRARAAIPADPISSAEAEARRLVGSEFPGRIVFDSNRSGTFGIYTVNGDGSDARPLVDSKQEEMFPDPSPDGAWIAYARALGPSRTAYSEIWVIRSNGSDARRLASNGTYPTFSSDGKSVYFQRNRDQLLRVNFETGEEALLFPKNKKTLGKFSLVMPRVSPDGKFVAFTSDKPDRWNAWIADIETEQMTRIGHGCEPGWAGAQGSVSWVSTANMLERSGINLYSTDTSKNQVLHDLDAPRGHEYFPTLVDGDRFLLYGACSPGGHDHFEADYQIFVKDLKNDRLARITFDGATNRWPKLLVSTTPE